MDTPNGPSGRDFIIETLTEFGACDDGPDDALPWARSLPADATPEGAWNACENGSWIVWLLGRLHERGLVPRETLVLAACAAARTALAHVAAGELRPLAAIETAERWCRGQATAEQVRASGDDADDAAADASAASADADAAADAAAYAASAASAAYAADRSIRRREIADRSIRRREIADAVRAVVSWATISDALGLGQRGPS